MSVPGIEHSHQPSEIARRIQASPKHSYLADFVYGAIDGTVTTFAVVSGVAGAGLSSEVIVILSLANLVGDGFSMAASNYLGSRTDAQLLEKARQMERRHIANYPEGEREEIRQVFASKGFDGEDLQRVVEVITSDENRWINTMLTEELGMSLHRPSALKSAITTFLAFILVGFIPLAVFVLQLFTASIPPYVYLWSTVLTGFAFFGIGAAKSRFVGDSWYKSGLETLFVGGMAAVLAYVIGVMLRGILPT